MKKSGVVFGLSFRSLLDGFFFLALGVNVSCRIVTLLMGWLTLSCCFQYSSDVFSPNPTNLRSSYLLYYFRYDIHEHCMSLLR